MFLYYFGTNGIPYNSYNIFYKPFDCFKVRFCVCFIKCCQCCMEVENTVALCVCVRACVRACVLCVCDCVVYTKVLVNNNFVKLERILDYVGVRLVVLTIVMCSNALDKHQTTHSQPHQRF